MPDINGFHQNSLFQKSLSLGSWPRKEAKEDSSKLFFSIKPDHSTARAAQMACAFFKEIGEQSASDLRRKREVDRGGGSRAVASLTQAPPSFLSKYDWVNERVNQTLLNEKKEQEELYFILIKHLFNGRSLFEFAWDQVKQTPAILNDALKEAIEDVIKKEGPDGELLLNPEALALIMQGVYSTFPALYLNDQTFPILSATWSYLHAGSLYCLDHAIKPFKLAIEEVCFLGFFLAILAQTEDNQEIVPYFKTPATLYYLIRHPDVKKEASLKEIYTEYFEALMDMHEAEEKIILAADNYSKAKYQVRKELVKGILVKHGIAPHAGKVDQYIYASNHGIACFLEDHSITQIFSPDWTQIHDKIYRLARERDPIDVEYDKQNEEIAKRYAALDFEKLKGFFISFAPQERDFIAKASVSFCEPVFRDTNIPVSTMVKSPVLALGSPDKSVHLSERIDLHIFSATLRGEVRYYVLKMSESFTYSLLRVDKNRESYLSFLPSERKAYPHFKFSLNTGARLKGSNESIHSFFRAVVEKNKRSYKKILSDGGYDRTKAEKVIDLVTGFIPFYHFIHSINKGEYENAAIALTFDIIGWIPLIGVGGKVAAISSRGVGTALLKAATQQRAMREFLKISVREFTLYLGKVPVKSLSTEVLKATALSIDPGVYPLYSVGRLALKGSVNLSKKIVQMIKRAKELGLHDFPILLKEMGLLVHRIDFANIEKRVTEQGQEITVVKLENWDETVDYVRIEPKIQVLFGPKYTLGKNNKLLQKIPIEMVNKEEKYISDKEVETILETINKEVSEGCFSQTRHHRGKRNNPSCSIDSLSGEEMFYAMEALNKERERLSTELEPLRQKLERISKELETLDQKGSVYQARHKEREALDKEYWAKKRRVDAYPIVIQTLTESPIYRMRLAKDLFLNYRSSSKEIYTRYLDQGVPFERIDERGNGILHYLATATHPEAVTFFFSPFLKQDFGLKEALIRRNKEGKTPFELLIGNVALERYKRGYQGVFDKMYEFFQSGLMGRLINRRVVRHQTVFDQIFEFFERHVDLEAIPHEVMYDIFNAAWKREGERRFERSHWTKVRAWVEAHFLGKINAIDKTTGETLLNKAIKRENLRLIHYLISKETLDVRGIPFGDLYDIFAFTCKHSAERLIQRWVSQTFFGRVDAFDPTNGETLLHRAIRDRNAHLVEFLKDNGARDRIENFSKKTPEDLAKEDASLLYPIFDRAAQVEGSDSEFELWVRESFFGSINQVLDSQSRDTLLHQACRASRVELIIYLKNHGATDAINNSAQNIPEQLILENMGLLYQVIDRSRLLQRSAFDAWVKRFFLSRINTIFDPINRDTLLHQAIRNENIDLFAYLKDHGAIEQVNLERKTPAALVSGFNVVYKIFDKASQVEGLGSPFEGWAEKNFFNKVNLADPETGDTLLHQAIHSGQIDLVAYLKNHGARDRIKNIHEMTPEDFAKDLFFYDGLYKMFNKASQVPGSLFEIWVRKYFFSRINDQVFFESGETLLHKAVESQNVNLIAYLKNHGAKDQVQNFSGKTPEDLVSPSLLYKIFDKARGTEGSPFEQWVRNQFFVRIDTILDQVGDTLPHKAARNGNVSLLVYLKNLGTRDRVANFGGQTPETLICNRVDVLYRVFDEARKYEGSRSKFEQWVNEQFLSHINAVDPENGDTLLHKAAREHRLQLFDYLKSRGAKGGVRNALGETPESLEALAKARGIQRGALSKTHRKREKENSDVHATTENIVEEPSTVVQTQSLDRGESNGSLSSCTDRIGREEQALDGHKRRGLLFLGHTLEQISVARKSNDLVLSLGEEKKIAIQGYYLSKESQLMLRDKQCRRFLLQGNLQENQMARFKSNETGSLALEIEPGLMSHSINKRSLESLTQFEQGGRMQDPITENAFGLFDTALLARAVFHKKSMQLGRNKKSNGTSRLLKAIEIQKMVCQEGLEKVEEKLNHAFFSNLIEESELSRLRREAKDLKEAFQQLLNQSPMILDAFNRVQKRVVALEFELGLIENFQAVLEKAFSDEA